MDFFAQQDEARRTSRWLVLWFLLAVTFVGAAMALVAVLVVTVFLMMLGAVPGSGRGRQAFARITLPCVIFARAYGAWSVSRRSRWVRAAPAAVALETATTRY